ncbi:hypothetical protein BKA81DRAFT_367156 [Phyllosticta paracitricarpa]
MTETMTRRLVSIMMVRMTSLRRDKTNIYLSGDVEYNELYWGRYCGTHNGHVTTKKSLDNRPQGFKWTCCEQECKAEVCQTDGHVDSRNGGGKKRVRLYGCCVRADIEL